MKKKDIINSIRSAYKLPAVVRGVDDISFISYEDDSINVFEACKECADIVISFNESIKYDSLKNKSYTEYDIIFKKDNHGGVTAQEAMDNLDNAIGGWIDLDIDNLPEFIKKDVAIQKFYEDRWVDLCKYLKSSIAYDIVEPTISTKYRYRTQEKKQPEMYITKSDMEALSMYYFNRKLALIDFAPAMNREVIIID